jgi:L-rhamnose mutarotase
MRKAFVMSVNSGAEAEYMRRHNPIWPELEATLKAHGMRNYSRAAIAETPECKKWWRHVVDLMPHNTDLSPVADETLEVFHLD